LHKHKQHKKSVPEHLVAIAALTYSGNESALTNDTIEAPHYESFSVPRNYIRIALCRNVTSATVSSAQTLVVSFNNKDFEAGQSLAATITTSPKIINISGSSGASYGCELPCTVSTDASSGGIEYNGSTYRGKLVFVSEQSGHISVINYIGVEDYLCGVVPLEIGSSKPEDEEAARAQAVAARTYTYKRMLVNENKAYDMLASVADQVYGGINAEKDVCSRAVMTTANGVLVYGDSLITAYYHSTCGGTTANVEQVWPKHAQTYLQSVDDHSDDGTAYCAFSRYSCWREAWSIAQLSGIIHQYSQAVYPKNPASGTIESIEILSRFNSGRVASCRITTSTGHFDYGGDNLRFLFRRSQGDPPILRSANISDVHIEGDSVIMTGVGYGHGVGMCQCGAIGRAHAGQTFEQILQTYYTGVELRTVVVE
jgi:stage II sporulation protein D